MMSQYTLKTDNDRRNATYEVMQQIVLNASTFLALGTTEKRETARPLFFFVGYICLLCALFIIIVKLLKTNRMCNSECDMYKILIYSINIA